MSFICVPNHVHWVSLSFWVIVLQDVDAGLEEQHSLGTSFGFPGCDSCPDTPKAPGGPADAATSSLWALPEDRSSTSTPCAALVTFVSHSNWENCGWLMRKKTNKTTTNCSYYFFPSPFLPLNYFQKQAKTEKAQPTLDGNPAAAGSVTSAAHGVWLVLSQASPTFTLQGENNNLKICQSNWHLFWALKTSAVKNRKQRKEWKKEKAALMSRTCFPVKTEPKKTFCQPPLCFVFSFD